MRRLLENGANTSFVHALLDERVPASAVVADPIAAGRGPPRPPRQDPAARRHLHATARTRSAATIRTPPTATAHVAALEQVDAEKLTAGPIVGGKLQAGTQRRRP